MKIIYLKPPFDGDLQATHNPKNIDVLVFDTCVNNWYKMIFCVPLIDTWFFSVKIFIGYVIFDMSPYQSILIG